MPVRRDANEAASMFAQRRRGNDEPNKPVSIMVKVFPMCSDNMQS
jgi:hypothetical protein